MRPDKHMELTMMLIGKNGDALPCVRRAGKSEFITRAGLQDLFRSQQLSSKEDHTWIIRILLYVDVSGTPQKHVEAKVEQHVLAWPS